MPRLVRRERVRRQRAFARSLRRNLTPAEVVAALVENRIVITVYSQGSEEVVECVTERQVEKIYRLALAELFQGTDYINMFKRREIYRHLSNAADRIAHCADTLQDMVVKKV